jgi:hypothetical protein
VADFLLLLSNSTGLAFASIRIGTCVPASLTYHARRHDMPRHPPVRRLRLLLRARAGCVVMS